MVTCTPFLTQAQQYSTPQEARDRALLICEYFPDSYTLVSCIFTDDEVSGYAVAIFDVLNNTAEGFYAKVQA